MGEVLGRDIVLMCPTERPDGQRAFLVAARCGHAVWIRPGDLEILWNPDKVGRLDHRVVIRCIDCQVDRDVQGRRVMLGL